MESAAYPVRVEAHLEPLSRWLWLIKWLLVIPHYVVLAVLWLAFAVSSVIAFFAILLSGRYPRAIFDLNVGVVRWSWRVAYYAYGALGTDRYPPFTLAEVEDYPAHLQIAYPEHLSRGLVLVKWWLLAIPHYIVVGLFVGGAWFLGRDVWFTGGGLIGILVLIAGVILAATGRYPQSLFDLVLGLNRWVLRVAAYAGLMTDEYPPFRLDTGGTEKPETLTLPEPGPPARPPGAPPAGTSRWTGGRIASLIIGSIMVLAASAPLVAGSVGLYFDRTQRDAAGFVTFGPEQLSTTTYAITSDDADFIIEEPARDVVRTLLGTIRIQVTRLDGSNPVFVGIAREADVAAYLADVERVAVTDLRGANRYHAFAGAAPADRPGSRSFWAASSSGRTGASVEWDVRAGSWAVVVMNAEGTRGIDVDVDLGVTAPSLPWVAGGLIAGGILMVVLGAILIVVPIRRASRV